jgi:hypothetical protein
MSDRDNNAPTAMSQGEVGNVGEAQDGSLSGDEEEEEEEPGQLQPMICLIHEQAKSMVAIQVQI